MARRGSNGISQLQSMAHCSRLHCWTPRSHHWPWLLQLWLLCVFSSLQTTTSWSDDCNRRGFLIQSGFGGSVVNLTVACMKDEAELSFTAGGLEVSSLRAAQNCTVLNGNETISEVQSVVERSSNQNPDYREPDVSPLLSEHLQESDIVCHYFGCYYSDGDSDVFRDTLYHFVFPNATCTFSQVFSSMQTVMPSTSLLSVDTSIPTSMPSLSLSVTPPDGILSFIIPTRSEVIVTEIVTESQKSAPPMSVATVAVVVSSHSISTASLTQPSAGNPISENLQWIILAALIAMLITLVIFISCLIFTIKRYFNSSIQGNIYDPKEPFDIKFAPVEIMPTSLTPSFSAFSITTKLDPLNESREDVNLEQFDSIMDPPGELADVNSATELSSDPSEDEDIVQTFEPIKLNTQNSAQPNSKYYIHHTDTPRVDNDIAWDQHEMSIFNLDSGSEDSNGRTEPMNGITRRRLSTSEASILIDILTPDTSQFNSDIHSGRLSNGYMHDIVGMYSSQRKGLGVTDEELTYDHESLPMIIQLDDMGPAEQRLMNSNGYVCEANDQLEHMNIQQWDQLYQGEEDRCDTNILGLQVTRP